MQHTGTVTDPGPMNISNRFKTVYAVLMFLGLIGFVLTLMRDADRAWHGYLVSYFYFTSIAVGGLFFVAIQHMTTAGWSVNIRRLVESLTAFLPIALVGGILVVIGGSHLYEWLHADVVAADELLQHKAPYLNRTFFIIRMVLFLGAWVWFAKILVGRSIKQDKTGDESLTLSLMKPSVIFILIFALSYSLFSVDTMMSLQPHWFSTIFGVYCFAGLFQTTMATTILLAAYFMKKGQLKGFVDENHMHDLGKFLFAFTVFWAYIAFSQYMLIW
ncbi:MAG: molybdopterin oxidoreductase, partial [Bdellovibrionales bacterium]|nr:molybdopterin oxidoreductase [Bdellovibrionales bacterium]